MTSKLVTAWGFISLFLLAGCAMATRSPLNGFFYTQVEAGLAASAQVATKQGQACASSILGIVATGDASIEAARRNGGITSIASVDEKFSNIVGIYATHCTIVRGR